MLFTPILSRAERNSPLMPSRERLRIAAPISLAAMRLPGTKSFSALVANDVSLSRPTFSNPPLPKVALTALSSIAPARRVSGSTKVSRAADTPRVTDSDVTPPTPMREAADPAAPPTRRPSPRPADSDMYSANIEPMAHARAVSIAARSPFMSAFSWKPSWPLYATSPGETPFAAAMTGMIVPLATAICIPPWIGASTNTRPSASLRAPELRQKFLSPEWARVGSASAKYACSDWRSPRVACSPNHLTNR